MFHSNTCKHVSSAALQPRWEICFVLADSCAKPDELVCLRLNNDQGIKARAIQGGDFKRERKKESKQTQSTLRSVSLISGQEVKGFSATELHY